MLHGKAVDLVHWPFQQIIATNNGSLEPSATRIKCQELNLAIVRILSNVTWKQNENLQNMLNYKVQFLENRVIKVQFVITNFDHSWRRGCTTDLLIVATQVIDYAPALAAVTA